jgi:hypothetical protein
MPMDQMDGILGEIGKCNAKDIPTPNSSHTVEDIHKSITKLMTQISHIQNTLTLPTLTHRRNKRPTIRTTLKDSTTLNTMKINKILQKIHKACTTAIDETPYYTNIDKVYQVKKMTKRMVITTLDKAEATLTAM